MRLNKPLVAAVAAVTFGLVLAAPAGAQEKKDIVLGVGGKGLLYYLPLTLIERPAKRAVFKNGVLEVRFGMPETPVPAETA